jgi:hypothetical protein
MRSLVGGASNRPTTNEMILEQACELLWIDLDARP